jgi:hypothetical protein
MLTLGRISEHTSVVFLQDTNALVRLSVSRDPSGKGFLF